MTIKRKVIIIVLFVSITVCNVLEAGDKYDDPEAVERAVEFIYSQSKNKPLESPNKPYKSNKDNNQGWTSAFIVFGLLLGGILVYAKHLEEKENSKGRIKNEVTAEDVLFCKNLLKEVNDSIRESNSDIKTKSPLESNGQKTTSKTSVDKIDISKDVIQRSVQLVKDKNYYEVIQFNTSYIEKHINEADLLYLRAIAYWSLKEKDECIADLKRAAVLGHTKAKKQLKKLQKAV